MKTDWKKGDTCYVFLPGHRGTKSKGKILEVLDLSEHGYINFPHYLVEIETHIEPLLEVYNEYQMAETMDGPIGFMSMVRDRIKKDKE